MCIISIDFHVEPRCAVTNAEWFAEIGLAPILPISVAYESFHIVQSDARLPCVE